ncbi:ferritin-like domain-containing protein [Mucilaginibacter rubeus]|uniref:PA2169 family four-helix-bundle protein n=1 Tax=Mucilaginibacter rubeus TaxID=2027860 RepID=A0A5C1HX25_9SPHI|nr:PA2169 family four-helix-bundle protein [Mucilaginibacter rubeus]QEM09979.1 PA2169 family four-helix-bundle protein [Mucilaginibacter rubeus]
METKTTSVLNELIEINNDRVAGFEKAIADIKDENIDLKGLFQRYAAQSRENSQELAALVGAEGDDVETGTSVSGSLHRAWIDVKSVFDGSTRESILSEAERGEDAIKKAYREALEDTELSATVRETITRQQSGINAAHDEVKTLRDASK